MMWASPEFAPSRLCGKIPDVTTPGAKELKKQIHLLIERMCSAQDARAACKRTAADLQDSIKVHEETIRDCQKTIGALKKVLKKVKKYEHTR